MSGYKADLRHDANHRALDEVPQRIMASDEFDCGSRCALRLQLINDETKNIYPNSYIARTQGIYI